MLCTRWLPVLCLLLIKHLPWVTPARAEDPSGPVNFQPKDIAAENMIHVEQRQSVLGCLTGCTRELRPVRGEQGGREVILPNKCSFNIEVCKASRNRQAPLLLSQDQSDIVYPSTGL
eukprot:TRINITY_DN7355_c0_g1_i2.p1 TRINITY_DN7355_c0_g1~~TRINITY_DN7355_c0_g1_i2.p1  ORF type:complete len:117 (-),score=27.88 TRINITY_DN7355_c0_g1_i2:379-729(-)